MTNYVAFVRRVVRPGPFPTRLLLWSLAVAAILGAVAMLQPLEDMMRSGRNLLRSHPASGDIVIAGIDDRSFDRLKTWPLPRDIDAKLIKDLFDLGARRVFVDLDLSSSSSPADDQQLARTIAPYGKRVVLAGRFYLDTTLGTRTDPTPIPILLRHADVGNINFRFDYSGSVWRLPSTMAMGGKTYTSFAVKLADRNVIPVGEFPIDFSINPRTIPLVSAIDVLDGKVADRAVAGKDVIIAARTDQVQDIYNAPGYGRIAGVYFHVLGAETLRSGMPIEAGWLCPFLIAALITAGCLTMRRLPAVCALSVAALVVMIVPAFLEARLIFIDIMPSLTLFLIPICALTWREMRIRIRSRSTTNALSGLLNLNALKLETVEIERLLIVARVHNYAEVIAMLPAEAEKPLIAQIAARLTLGAPDLQLYQGDDGVFAWFTNADSASLGDHLAALYALFRSPVAVVGINIDLVVTFGVDSGRDRSIANRLGSALVAASEATMEGSKWKEFDASKLKDAAWKLSLLSQLDAAIDGGDLWVAYQPKLDLATNRITGAEALVRWTHPAKGAISPMEFVVAAEQHNRIEKLTMHVLERAITTAAAINAHGIHFGIAVNLSVRLLEDNDLASVIGNLLARLGLDPTLLTLEITETAALSAENGLSILRDLRDRGIRVSIDDYGTGLSTLEYLKKIPANEIKIDKTFIQSMTDAPGDLLMVNSTIQLAHSLGHVVVAEGVELATTLERLIEMKCDTAQGYLIGRPMTFQALTRRLLSERRRAA